MSETKCPLCGSQRFYVRNPEDQYELYEFDLNEGKVIFDPETTETEPPQISAETETYCNKCAWHDSFKTLK